MISYLRISPRSFPLGIVALAGLFLAPLPASIVQAQQSPAARPGAAHNQNAARPAVATIPALLVSDIHFDPFHDPAKAKALVAAPLSEWKSILSAPSSANQASAFAALQDGCHARGVDTPYALLHSSLQTMKTRLPAAKFMTVSGDLVVHGFPCRFSKLVPNAAPGAYQDFVVKTISFVMLELRSSFPAMPIYVGLGNNDSGCGDYQLDTGGDFLAQTGKAIAEGLPPAEREDVLKQFGAGGYYSVPMAAPMRDTRLIVVNDLFLSPKYSTCANKPDAAATVTQMAWLQQQLQDARQANQKVWVMGHIPPGVDPYSTVARFRNVCGGQSPVSFLASDRMVDLMTEYADVVHLGLFGHTHMDEMRLLEPEGADAQASAGHRVAVKLVPSISPVDGNKPAFTIASIDAASSNLKDYEVIKAADKNGAANSWSTEYDFAKTYGKAEFSSAAVESLVEEFKADHSATGPRSVAYIHNYYVGDMSPELSPFWPQYVCALGNLSGKSYSACVCSNPN